MNFKSISFLFILLFSVVGMSNAATIHLQHLGCRYYGMHVWGLRSNGSTTHLADVQTPDANFTNPYPTSYDYNHTGEYTALELRAAYGKLETSLYFHVRNLSNIYTYPSDDMVNLSLVCHDTYHVGILGLDNKVYDDYDLPAYY